MKNSIIKYAAFAAISGLFMTGCTEEVDNEYSRFPSVIKITASAEEIVLNEDTPDDVALTLSWSEAADHGSDYMTTYVYEYDLEQKSAPHSEEVFEGEEFVRTYTHADLQEMLVDDYAYSTSTWGTMVFSITANFEGTAGAAVVLPDQDEVTVRIKTYGDKQFAADQVFLGGTAVGSENIGLTPSETNPDLYVYNGNLAAGGFNFPVVYGDENNVIIPAGSQNVTVESGETYDAVVVGSDETAYSWNITEADSYRVSLNFSNHTVSVIKTSEIMEVDKIFMSGSAAGAAEIEVTQTLENESLYAWRGTLSAGTLSFPIEFGGERNLTMVPNSNDHGFNDGQANPFTTVNSSAAGSRYWEIPEEGTYRIVIDTDARTVTIYSAATDLKPMTVSFKRTQAPAEDPCTVQVETLYIFGDDVYYSGSQPKGDPYILTQSLANPRLFVYKGEALKKDNIKFCVTDHWNNEYAFGSGPDRDKDLAVTAGQTVSPIYGGQGNNRYAMFSLPDGVINYIEVYVGPESADESDYALSKVFERAGSYVIFDQR